MTSLVNTIILILFLLFTTGCFLFDDVRIAERVLVNNDELPSVESADVLQASMNYHPQIPQIASRVEREAGIDRNTWSVPVQLALAGNQMNQGSINTQLQTASSADRQSVNTFGRTPVPAENELIITEHLNRITSQTKRAEWNGRNIFFISVAVDEPVRNHSGVQHESPNIENPSRIHRLYALDEQGSGVTHFETKEVEPVFLADGLPRSLPSQPLRFDVVVTDKGPTVIYRDRDGIYARSLTFDVDRETSSALSGNHSRLNAKRGRDIHETTSALSGNRYFAFGERQLIAKADVPYGEFQLISRLDREGAIHLVWTDSRDKHALWYCNFKPENGNVCNKPVRIARTASSDPVNLMIHNDKIYISWTDNRYTQGLWTRKNFAKLLLAKSNDGGKSFNSPVSVNPPRDDAENAAYSVVLPASGEGILVFWGTDVLGSGAKNQDLFYGWLSGDLGTLHLGMDKFPGNLLHELIHQKMMEYQTGLGNF